MIPFLRVRTKWKTPIHRWLDISSGVVDLIYYIEV